MDATTLTNLWPKIEMKLPRWASIALAILILITLAKVVVGFFDSGSNKVITTPTTAASTNVKPQPRANHDRKIAQLHLMGKPAPATKQVKDAPETTLNLKLLGVLAGGKDYGYAIISSGGNKIKHYSLGDDVPGGATLHAVFSDRVILERDIRMETLRLPRANAKGFNQKKPSKTTKATAPQSKSAENETNFETVGQFRQVIMKNPVRLTEFINATPENKDGKFLGYKLTPSTNTDMFYQLGLEPGDVVININDIVLDAPNKGPQAMQTLSTATEIKMIVMRAGTEITLLQDMSQ